MIFNAKNFNFIRLIAFPLLLAYIIGYWLVAWLVPDSKPTEVTKGLPSYLIEDENIANWCADELESKYPRNWNTMDARRCIDALNGYKNLNGKTVHPYKK